MNSYFAVGVLFLLLGIVFLLVLDSPIVSIVLIVVGALLAAQSYWNARSKGRTVG